MNKKILFGIATAIGFVAFSSVFAASGSTTPGFLASLDVNNVKVASVTATGVNLSWDSLTGATTYVVSYDTKSVATSTDPNAVYTYTKDLTGSTGGLVDGLKPDTTYYFSVIARDAQGNESNSESLEVTTKTSALATASVSSFALATSGAVTVDSATTLTLSFNAKLNAKSPVSVSVVSNLDKSDLGAKAVVAADATKATVTLTTALKDLSSYTVTVKSATDVTGRNVQMGADAIREFSYTAPVAKTPISTPTTTSTTTATMSSEITIAQTPELNAAPATSAEVTLAPTKALPETGPAENLVVAMALLLGAGYVALRRKSA